MMHDYHTLSMVFYWLKLTAKSEILEVSKNTKYKLRIHTKRSIKWIGDKCL